MNPADPQSEHQWLLFIASGVPPREWAIRALFEAYHRRFLSYFLRNGMADGDAEDLLPVPGYLCQSCSLYGFPASAATATAPSQSVESVRDDTWQVQGQPYPVSQPA